MGTAFTHGEIDQYAPEGIEEQEEFVRDQETEEVYYVAVYAVNRNFGGPEEGGWWWDSGELIDVRTVEGPQPEAMKVRDRLLEKYPFTKNRYSVLGGEDYDVMVCDSLPPASFPDEVPHYE